MKLFLISALALVQLASWSNGERITQVGGGRGFLTPSSSESSGSTSGIKKISDQFIDKRKERRAPIQGVSREDLTNFDRLLQKDTQSSGLKQARLEPGKGAAFVGEYAVEYSPAVPVPPAGTVRRLEGNMPLNEGVRGSRRVQLEQTGTPQSFQPVQPVQPAQPAQSSRELSPENRLRKESGFAGTADHLLNKGQEFIHDKKGRIEQLPRPIENVGQQRDSKFPPSMQRVDKVLFNEGEEQAQARFWPFSSSSSTY